MTRNLNRRLFLRGLGGAAVAAPFLSSVHERAAKAQSLPVEVPKRLIVMFSHYGCLTNRWFPATAHGALTAAELDATTLKHLSPYVSKLLIPRGIRGMNEWSFGGELGQTTDPHTQVVGSYFTCYPVSGGKFDAMPTGRSLDHIAAEQVNPNSAAPLHIQIGGVRNDAQSAISYSNAGEPFPGIGTPTSIYNNLTNLFGEDSPDTMTPDSYRVARGKSIIDIVRDDLASLQRIDMSQSDARKVSDWVDLLHESSKPVAEIAAQCTRATADELGVSAAGQGNLGAVTPLMLNLAVLSAICDANRVIFLKFPGAVTFNWDGITHNYDTHGISHRGGTANMGDGCVPEVLNMIAQIDDWYAQKFAFLVGQLNSFDEGDVKLLDNTATVWFNELSDGNSHNLNNLPILQAGSCGGYFKVGEAINLEDGAPTMNAGNSEGACGDSGQDNDFGILDSLGTPADTATQPINKYFCNLLNAIGVKAGADGFPAIGGTGEVTHYGKYDSSADFNSDKPVTINNPGEYSELRASS